MVMGLRVCNNVIECIGAIPIVRLSGIEKDASVEFEIWGKMEFTNPTGSVKDRMALYMIRRDVEKGELKPGMTLVVPTTGTLLFRHQLLLHIPLGVLG